MQLILLKKNLKARILSDASKTCDLKAHQGVDVFFSSFSIYTSPRSTKHQTYTITI